MEKVGSHNLISFVARHASVDIHYHQCLQVVVSLRVPFDSVIDGTGYSRMNGFLINQAITHSCKAENTEVLIYFIDAESYQGWQLKEMLDGRPFVPIDSILTEQELNEVMAQYGRAAVLADIQQTADDLMAKILHPRQQTDRNIDERIAKAIEYINLNLDNPLALADIASQVFLSPERLRHLFAQETGISFSQYVLWKRIKLVMTQVISGQLPMANAAIRNGFTDQAHFTRLFKRTFGVNAKGLLQNSRFVQFLTPEV
jgi:AraC-like DNA-binding protein